jgi:putative ABC transport system permease protein
MWLVLKGSLARSTRVVHTALGVVLAVSLVCGTFVLTDTINAAFTQATAPVPGQVDVVVRSAAAFGATGQQITDREPMPASVLAAVQAVVGTGQAWGTVFGYVQVVGPDGRPVTAKGLPAMGTGWAPDTALIAGGAPSQDGQVAVDARTARQAGLKVGDRVKIALRDGTEELTVTGLTEPSKLVSSTVVTFDLATAQRVLGRSQGGLDAVSVRAAPGTSAEALRARVGAALPGRYEVLTADQAAKQAKESWTRALGFLTTGLLAFAAVALLVGGFIIFNTFSILVAHRSRELGLLRAVGASRAQLLVSVLAEAALVGAVASAVGVVGGLLAARGLLVLLRSTGLSIPTTSVVFQPRAGLVSLVTGVAVTIVAAVQPAIRATAVSPLVALVGGEGDAAVGVRRRHPIAAGAAVIVAGLASIVVGMLGVVPRPLVSVGIGAALVLVGLVLVVPLLVTPTAHLLGRPLARLLGEPAVLGRENALRSPQRTAATATALMIGIGLIGVVAVMAASMKSSATTTVQKSMRADFVVSTYQVPGASSGVPLTAADRLRQSPAVEAVSEIRSGQWGLDGTAQTLVAVDPATVTGVYELDADSAAAAARLDDGGVLVRDSVAARHGWRVGDTVPMTFARTGTRPAVLRSTYATTTVRSDYVVSLGSYAANYAQLLDMEIDVRLAPGTSATAGRRAIRTALVDFPNLAVRDRSEVLAAQESQVNRLLVPVMALLALSVVIALLGIANTLALSIHERLRELGMLRAIGMARSQLRSMIRSEALIVAGLGAMCGVAVAVGFGWVAVTSMRGLGVTRRVFPVGQLALLVAAATLAGLAAAAAPARRAGRLAVLDAVGND